MPVFIGIFISWLAKMLLTRAGGFVASAMAAIGIQFAAQSFLVEPAITMVTQSFTGIPSAQVLAWLSYIGLDNMVTTILSAYAANASMGWLRVRALTR